MHDTSWLLDSTVKPLECASTPDGGTGTGTSPAAATGAASDGGGDGCVTLTVQLSACSSSAACLNVPSESPTSDDAIPSTSASTLTANAALAKQQLSSSSSSSSAAYRLCVPADSVAQSTVIGEAPAVTHTLLLQHTPEHLSDIQPHHNGEGFSSSVTDVLLTLFAEQRACGRSYVWSSSLMLYAGEICQGCLPSPVFLYPAVLLLQCCCVFTPTGQYACAYLHCLAVCLLSLLGACLLAMPASMD
jgi:hypothetical protein